MMTLTIGRKSDSDIVLSAETVSRRHALLHVLSKDRFIVEDCDSTSGTFIKDERSWRRVIRTTVTLQDLIKVGDLQLSVSELLAKASRPVQIGEVVEAHMPPRPGSRFERDPETGEIRERRS